jgi:dienelactone hydrolase
MRQPSAPFLSLVLALAALPRPAAGQEPPLDARALARRVEVVAEPVHPFRYNQPIPAPNQTKPLLARRRAFVPGERVTLSFRLPPGAAVAGTVRAKLALSLHDLDGAKHADLGETALVAGPAVEGTLAFTVPEAAAGRLLLAGRFTAEDGQVLATRSNVVLVTAEYPRLLEAARAALDEARGKVAKSEPLLREVSLPSTEMLVEDAEMRWSDFGDPARDWEFVKRQLETASEYARRLSAGEDPWKGRTGAFTKAYRSEVDGTLQPYALYVPPSYDPAKAWPMMVSLHGATSNHILNRRRVFGLGNAPGEQDYDAIRNEVSFPDTGFVVLAPYGRGEVAGYNGLAERDVLRAMDHVERAYRVDPDRVHLTGLSMGGGGTWHIGLRFPDRFASIAPVCAVADMDMMPWTAGWGAVDREWMGLTGYSRIVENAANQRVLVFHGDEDDAVTVAASRRMVEAFEKAGLAANLRYFELPGVTHFAWDFAYRDASLFERVREIRRNPVPERVVYSTFSPRYNKAYWLRIDRIEKGLALARVEGTQKAGVFDLAATNVAALSLLLSPAIAPPGEPVEVRVAGKRVFRGTPKGSVLSLARSGGGWKTTSPFSGPAQGPPDRAEAGIRAGGGFASYGPYVYVYGTLGDAAMTAAAKAGAEALAAWGPNVRARWRVLADTEVTPEILEKNDLVLVGSATTNRVLAGLVGLPIHQDAAGTWAGRRKLAGPGATYRLLAPNPGVPSRLVQVYGGSTPAALQRFVPSAWRQAPPFSQFADYVVVEEDGTVVLEGFFRDGYTIPGR